MKKLKIYLLSALLIGSTASAWSNTIDSCRLEFSRKGKNDNYFLHVKCQFTVSKDTVQLVFGGGDAMTLSQLSILSDNLENYRYDTATNSLTLYMRKPQPSEVELDYDYANLLVAFAFIATRNTGTEFWTTTERGLDFYPRVAGEQCHFSVSIDLPNNWMALGGYPLQKQGNHYTYTTPGPISANLMLFALLEKKLYDHSEFTSANYSITAYYPKGAQIPPQRKTELADLTKASIDWFSKIYREPYQNEAHQIEAKPTFLFHDGAESLNQNEVNLIWASREKFCTKPNIMPLVHEIGHRWLGEWTLMVEEGEPAAYFLLESLDEYMTMLFARHYYGEQWFDQYYKEFYLDKYAEIKGTKNDAPLIDMKQNNNWAVVYYKGPIILHKIVSEWGEENWLDFIRDFYNRYKYVPHLTYAQFIATMAEHSPEYAAKLDRMVRANEIE